MNIINEERGSGICGMMMKCGTVIYTLLNVYMFIDMMCMDSVVYNDQIKHYMYRMVNMISIFFVDFSLMWLCYQNEKNNDDLIKDKSVSMLLVTFLSFVYFPILDLHTVDFEKPYRAFSDTVVCLIYMHLFLHSIKYGYTGLKWFSLLELVAFILLDSLNFDRTRSDFTIIFYKAFSMAGMWVLVVYSYKWRIFRK